LIIDQDPATGERLQTGDALHQRALATAAGADDADELARLNIEVDVHQRLHIAALGRIDLPHTARCAHRILALLTQ
jgi:hypothetical protein